MGGDLVVRDDGDGGTWGVDGGFCTSVAEPSSGGVKEVGRPVSVEIAEVLRHLGWRGNGPTFDGVGGEHAVELNVGMIVRYAVCVGGSQFHDFGPEIDLRFRPGVIVVKEVGDVDCLSAL